MGRKVIFLDVDGVLNSDKTKTRVPYWKFRGVEKKYVARIAKIVQETGAEIILSSSWKDGWDKTEKKHKGWINYLLKNLAEYKLTISGVTPTERQWILRGKEIEDWLSENPTDEYVIIDDEYFKDFEDRKLNKHLVHTYKKDEGISDDDVENAISILNGILPSETEKEIGEKAWKNELSETKRLRLQLKAAKEEGGSKN